MVKFLALTSIARCPSRSSSCPARFARTTGKSGATEALATFSTSRPVGLHACRKETDEPVSMLMLFAPGAPRESYFEGLAGLADIERTQFFVDHDSYFV